MKTFLRASLPEHINYNKKKYVLDRDKTSLLQNGKLLASQIAGSVMVKVLSRRLKSKTNLHGNPYQPTAWIYSKEG